MPFIFEKTSIDGLVVVKPRVFGDSRGFFLETYRRNEFADNGIDGEFVQDNHSYSGKNVLRGLHFQREPFAQGKLVRVVSGAVWDVAVDLRSESPSCLRWHGLRLDDDNRVMFYIPPCFAHGFVALTDNVHLVYKCTNYYSADHDGGIIWNDPDIGIDWPMKDPELSEKDMKLPKLRDVSHV